MNPHDLLDTALTGDPIDALPAIQQLHQILTRRQLDHVLTLRRHTASWAFIANILGVTRQAALQRYHHWQPPTQT